MPLIVLASDSQKAEWGQKEEIVWITDAVDFLHYPIADAFIDLLYVNTGERNAILRQLFPKPVFINSVMDTLAETDDSFIRINGWPTFLASPIMEAACRSEEVKVAGEGIFAALGKQPEWLPDNPGFVTARVVSMIINEAYLALAEGVSTKEEINTAMKLGTAYPFGPFDWAEKIGLKNIALLLQKLSSTQPRYTPAAGLLQEAFT
jgi:3-hydroxybutyryl-CoA dehydrogenase